MTQVCPPAPDLPSACLPIATSPPHYPTVAIRKHTLPALCLLIPPIPWLVVPCQCAVPVCHASVPCQCAVPVCRVAGECFQRLGWARLSGLPPPNAGVGCLAFRVPALVVFSPLSLRVASWQVCRAPVAARGTCVVSGAPLRPRPLPWGAQCVRLAAFRCPSAAVCGRKGSGVARGWVAPLWGALALADPTPRRRAPDPPAI